MIDVSKIKYNELIYYTPSFSNNMKVAVIKLISDDVALVQPRSKKDKEAKPFSVPIEHIYYKAVDANSGRRAWENYMRKRRSENSGTKRNH